ncbi:family 16 glycosylhydrolase [Aquimarina agarilytica]|uniref:family 16 glycosylhydrolase n=1 Tax=Aquimarina agarilytica TaxID=1087449 RepID=UPI000314B6CB|nr:family 16 glycosylhydrolase [Aquimarina agarilytica]
MKKLIGTLLLSTAYFYAVQAQNKPYKAAEIYTKSQYQYGKMEIRMLAAKGSGIISNFFTFKNGSEKPDTFWEEIDIEVFGKDNSSAWQSNLISGQGNSNLTRIEGIHSKSGLADNYHTYAIEWKPGSVTWKVNNEVVREKIGGQANELDDPASLRFNIWNPNIPEWVGSFNENILPVHMFVNWIKFYDWDGAQFSSSPTWEDNFTNFDTNFWIKANHTFNENQSDFIPQNATVKNGYLVLSITKETQTGYNGSPPIDTDESTLSTTDFTAKHPVSIQLDNEQKKIKILGLSKKDNSAYSIHSIDGKKILSGKEKTIDLNNLSAGVYIFIINDTSKKFIIK